MIGKLRGYIDSVAEGHLVLDVGGVGYLVFGASIMLQQLDGCTDEQSLLIETHVREDHIHLYGFLTEADRGWFRLLMTVQGVGAKMALAIQSTFSADELTTIISAQDKIAITRASGVGKKLGERIITELKSKVGKLPVPTSSEMGLPANAAGGKTATSSQPVGNKVLDDAVSALVNLGYARMDAFTAVARVVQENPDGGLDDAIRLGLRELAA